MRIIEYRYPGALPADVGALAACLGFFDGVHLGHRLLIADTVARAEAAGLVSAVFTFPSESPMLKRGAARIYSTEQKLAIFEQLGVEVAVLCDFESVSALTPEEFVKNVLCRDLGVRIALSGEDFRFGCRASGDSDMLSRMIRSEGGEAVIHKMEYYELPSGRVQISASLIREYLSSAKPELAAVLLGAPYRITGRVSRGDGRGRSYGYPTVNTEIAEDSPLAHGVYHTEILLGGRVYTGLTNVGRCPTFGERVPHAETYILDFDGDAYGESAEISFIGYIREERVFESADELKREIDKNIKEVLARTGGGTCE